MALGIDEFEFWGQTIHSFNGTSIFQLYFMNGQADSFNEK
jgi:hypothetical protein